MKHLQKSRIRRVAKYVGDAALLTGAYYAAFALRFDGALPPDYWHRFAYSAPLVVLTKLILLHHFGLYRCFWKHTGIPELTSLVKALSLGTLFVTADYAIAVGFVVFPRSIILFDWLISLFTLAAFRMAPRLLRNQPVLTLARQRDWRSAATRQNVLLYGAGDLGASLAEQIAFQHSRTRRILGFIDDEPSLAGMNIHGFEVLGDHNVLPKIVARYGHLDQIIITISAISGKQLNRIADLCRPFSPNVLVAPGLDELFLGKVSVSDLREVQIEDLLGRESAKVNLDEEQLQTFLSGTTILVTGAGGSIGSELCFQILKFRPKKLVLFGRGENSIHATKHRLIPHANGVELEEIIGDIINYSKVERIFRSRRPDLVFHAAADKHVPLMELNPDEAVLNNIIGTQNILTAADQYRTQRVVCISSDKAVNPSSIMGCCKRVTELLVQTPKFSRIACAVRFGNVMGSRGSVIPLFKKQIAEGGPLTITDPEVSRYFMTIPEAVLLVLQAGALSSGGEMFLLEMGQPIRLLDLARQMVRLSGLREDDVPIEFTGLRPGEKLEEELSFSYETVERTAQPKLYRLRSPHMAPWDLEEKIQQLKALGIMMDFDGIRRTLPKVVPEYRPEAFSPANASTSPIANAG
jgi:FlaA1/EpsC-like NDP-sugar epimerase